MIFNVYYKFQSLKWHDIVISSQFRAKIKAIQKGPSLMRLTENQ